MLVLWTEGQYQGMDRNRVVAGLPIELTALPQGTTITAGTGELLHNAIDHLEAKITLEALPTYFSCAVKDGKTLEARVRDAVYATFKIVGERVGV